MNHTLQLLEDRILFSAGLSAEYFDNMNLTNQKLTRTDAQINFDWASRSPDRLIAPNTFSARWTGYIQAPHSERYTLSASSDDGVRVWVDGKLVIDHWKASAGTWSGAVDLEAGTYHPIKIEYFENRGKAKIQLRWSSASTPLQLIPGDRLFTSIPPEDDPGEVTQPSPIPPPPPPPLDPPESFPVNVPDPIVITQGGTYSGNWQSTDPNVPAVIINTTEPVTIVDSKIKSRGDLIATWVDHTNLTLDHVTGAALNPNVAGKSPGRFLDDEQFDNIVVQNCTMVGTSGMLLDTYRGNYSADNTIKILNNNATNIDGRHSDGNGSFVTFDERIRKSDGFYEEGYDIVQFVQIAKVHGLGGIEVAGNSVVNEPGDSRVEDTVSIYQSSGTAISPILIHDNYINGAYNVAPWQSDYSDSEYNYKFEYTGGGIMLGDGGTTASTVPAFVNAYNNTLIDTTNYGLAITSGHDLHIYNNTVSSSGVLPDGQPVVNQNVGIAIWNGYREKATLFFNNSGHDNQVYWFANGIRNDWWVPDATSWLNNVASLIPLP